MTQIRKDATKAKRKGLVSVSEVPMVREPQIYLDSAASTYPCEASLKAMDDFSRHKYATVHRGLYRSAQAATQIYEQSRDMIAKFFDCNSKNVILTRGSTDSINLLVSAFAHNLSSKDQIITSIGEHHSLFVPLQQLCAIKKCKLVIVPTDRDGNLSLDALKKSISRKTKLIALAHVSNVSGAVLDVASVLDFAKNGKNKNVAVLIDGAQAASHLQVSMQSFFKYELPFYYVVSAHKLYGPTGAGAILTNKRGLDLLRPMRFGGHMIEQVTARKSTFAGDARAFEPGTPPFVQVIGFAAALAWISGIGWKKINEHEDKMMRLLRKTIGQHGKILFNPKQQASCISFTVPLCHAHDIAALLDEKNICVRAGHLCAQPLVLSKGETSILRASVAVYTDENDIKKLGEGLNYGKRILLR